MWELISVEELVFEMQPVSIISTQKTITQVSHKSETTRHVVTVQCFLWNFGCWHHVDTTLTHNTHISRTSTRSHGTPPWKWPPSAEKMPPTTPRCCHGLQTCQILIWAFMGCARTSQIHRGLVLPPTGLKESATRVHAETNQHVLVARRNQNNINLVVRSGSVMAYCL